MRSIEIRGQEKLAKLARNMASVNVDSHFTNALKEAAFIAEGGIKRAITYMDAVDTGYMRASTRITKFERGKHGEAAIGPTADYSIYVHEGTDRMRARPFIEYGYAMTHKSIDRVLEGTAFTISKEIVRGV